MRAAKIAAPRLSPQVSSAHRLTRAREINRNPSTRLRTHPAPAARGEHPPPRPVPLPVPLRVTSSRPNQGREMQVLPRQLLALQAADRKSTRLNSSHVRISYA